MILIVILYEFHIQIVQCIYDVFYSCNRYYTCVCVCVCGYFSSYYDIWCMVIAISYYSHVCLQTSHGSYKWPSKWS